MESEKIIVLQVRFTRTRALMALALLFLCWHPKPLGSETLQLTTYYPAPYGGYVSILTTGNTYLSRDSGRVGIGTSSPSQKLDVAGNVQINSGTSGPTLIYNNSGEGSTIRMTGSNGSNIHLQSQNGKFRLVNHPWSSELFSVDQSGDARVSRDIYGNGWIRGFCSSVNYGNGGTVYCPGSRRVMGFYPTESSGKSGVMICCNIER